MPDPLMFTNKYKFSNKALGNFQIENCKADKLRAKNIASYIGSDAFIC